jgi:hypothetical protein
MDPVLHSNNATYLYFCLLKPAMLMLIINCMFKIFDIEGKYASDDAGELFLLYVI